LVKPDGTDLVDIAVINSNYDKIDANIASTKIQATKPATANAGDLWWDSNTGTLYLYYTDANSSQWVAATSDPVNIGVVANQSERDAQYPTPGQGMSVYRTDLGYRENYYGLYNASTNPGGRTPAGWYRETGIVLQRLHVSTSTPTSNSSTTSVDTPLSITITPKSTSSKILVLASVNGCFKSSGNAGNWMLLNLARNGAHISGNFGGVTNTATNLSFGTMAFNVLDAPGQTSPVTYTIRLANDANAAFVQINYGGCASGMTVLEISE
jgi:hypothetical protein